MTHSQPSTTPTDTMEWERWTWADRVTPLSNFRDHVPGDIPTPSNQQPAPSTYMTLMYNGHYTLSTTNYQAPTDTWLVHGNDSLLTADYTPPAHNPGNDTYTREDEPDDPHISGLGGAGPWTSCSPSAAATRALAGRCTVLLKVPNGPGRFLQSSGRGGSSCVTSRGKPPRTARDPPPYAPSS